MSRISAIGALCVICLAIPPAGFAQAPVHPARDRRLEDALSDIALLKRLVKEQDRRLSDLEKIVRALQPVTAEALESLSADKRPKAVGRPVGARWQNPQAWMQIREGMSRAEVEEILGKPISVESVIDYQTLIYKSEPAAPSPLMGTVKLTDDRVSQATPPAF
jgi:hypothetical protein